MSATTAPTARTLTPGDMVALTNALEDLVKAYNRLRAWHDRIDRHSAYKAAGLPAAEVERILDGKRVPPKAVKYEMYSRAGQIRSIIGEDAVPRPNSLDGIGAVIDAARKAIHGDLFGQTV